MFLYQIFAKQACRCSIIVIGFGESHATLRALKLDVEPGEETLTVIHMEAGRFIIAGAANEGLSSTFSVRFELKTAPAYTAVDLFSLG